MGGASTSLKGKPANVNLSPESNQPPQPSATSSAYEKKKQASKDKSKRQKENRKASKEAEALEQEKKRQDQRDREKANQEKEAEKRAKKSTTDHPADADVVPGQSSPGSEDMWHDCDEQVVCRADEDTAVAADSTDLVETRTFPKEHVGDAEHVQQDGGAEQSHADTQGDRDGHETSITQQQSKPPEVDKVKIDSKDDSIGGSGPPTYILSPFPDELINMREIDLANPNGVAQVSRLSHATLEDLLWRTVVYARYSWTPPRSYTEYPIDFQQMAPAQQRAEVEVRKNYFQVTDGSPLVQRSAVGHAVRMFLERVQLESAPFALANRSMALQIHASLEGRKVPTQRDLYGMFCHCYALSGSTTGAGVELAGLNALFRG